MDELTALARCEQEYRECSILCFTETWLHQDVPDNNIALAGFETIRADPDFAACGKQKGGGLAVFINKRWCHPGNISVKKRICCPDVELLAVGLRPYYLPREISHAILVLVYIPPSGNPTAACDVIHGAVAELQTSHPSALTPYQENLIMLTWTKLSQPSRSMWTVQLGKERGWTCCMPTLWTHTTLLLCPPWEDLTTIWYT